MSTSAHASTDSTPRSQATRRHPLTDAVRDFYERYPYPANAAPELRAGFDVRYVASLGALAPPAGRRTQVLDAGCGRALGLLACATTNPRAEYLGIDLNRVALREATASASRRELENLRFAEVDLETLEGLEVPDGGFDLIYSSGVVHHLVDPVAGLRGLREVLAPHGVISFMVYGSLGRQGIARVARALEAALDDELTLPVRLARARDLTQTLADRNDPDCPFLDATTVPDAEFVDRYLHPNEAAYDVPQLFDLVESAGLEFLSWADPGAWSSERWVPAGRERAAIEQRSERERFALIEQLGRPAKHELYLAHPENGRRVLPPRDEWSTQLFACHPEVRFEISSRNLWRESRVESVAYMRRDGQRVELRAGPLARAVFLLSTQCEPFFGATLFSELSDLGLSDEDSAGLIADLLARELIYAPHASELTR